jgi:hypothetical protein
MHPTEMMPPETQGAESTHSARPGGAHGKSRGAVTLSGKHDSVREGARLGVVVATSTWVWVALIDAIAGQPFHTFRTLGGIAAFTLIHYVLNLIYGVAIVSAIHGSVRVPSLIYALGFGFLVFEFAFAFLTVLLSNVGLGELAWLRIFVGNLAGTVVACVILAQRHPLLALLRQAEDER